MRIMKTPQVLLFNTVSFFHYITINGATTALVADADGTSVSNTPRTDDGGL